jgi:hypothetical protein
MEITSNVTGLIFVVVLKVQRNGLYAPIGGGEDGPVRGGRGHILGEGYPYALQRLVERLGR